MPDSVDLNSVKVFRISDLIGCNSSSPKRKREESLQNIALQSRPQRKRGKNQDKLSNLGVTESSSFKVSVKLAVQGNKPKKTKKSLEETPDVLALHQDKLNYFDQLQTCVLPKLQEELKSTVSSRKKLYLMEKINSIQNKEEEESYNRHVLPIVEQYIKILEDDDEKNMRQDTSGNITKYITKFDNVEKIRLAEEYCKRINNGLMISPKKLKLDDAACTNCGAATAMSDGFVSCTECGLVSEKSVQDYRLSYHDYQETLIKNNVSYKRINRFQEILATLQAKENTDIPEKVLDAVRKEINKEPDVDLSSIEPDRMKKYLRKLGYTSYYEHAPHILNKICGIPPINIPIEVEEKMREMFRDIQDPYELVKARECPTRTSFLSYHYVLYKFCELLDLDEMQKSFTLLKSIDKLRLQDKIWKGICEILGWEFTPSL